MSFFSKFNSFLTNNPFEYVGEKNNRSVSDESQYLNAVLYALKSYKNFMKFKKDQRYQAILEHVTESQGQKYLDIIKRDNPNFLRIESLKKNDLIGGGSLFEYDEVGLIGPTTLRYIKVASDLKKIFGADLSGRIAEIGVGYGGQLLVSDNYFKFEQYDLFDLPPVLNLVERYLESHVLNCAYQTLTLNQCNGQIDYDLVISNYAFSELPSNLQRMYIKKILSKSKRGYLTMNSGVSNSAFQDDKLTIEELKSLLPNIKIIPEDPVTHINNYVLIWGEL